MATLSAHTPPSQHRDRTTLGSLSINMFSPTATPPSKSLKRPHDDDAVAPQSKKRSRAAAPPLLSRSETFESAAGASQDSAIMVGGATRSRRDRYLTDGVWSDEVLHEENAPSAAQEAAARLRLRLKMAMYKVSTNQTQTPFARLQLKGSASTTQPARSSWIPKATPTMVRAGSASSEEEERDVESQESLSLFIHKDSQSQEGMGLGMLGSQAAQSDGGLAELADLSASQPWLNVPDSQGQSQGSNFLVFEESELENQMSAPVPAPQSQESQVQESQLSY